MAKKKEVNVPVSSVNDRTTVSVKKIANGYLIVKETYTDKGGYKTTETFSKTKPKVKVG